jgi:hypothetical protein
MDPHPRRRGCDRRDGGITVANEIPRDLVPWKRLAELLGGPRRRGMGRDPCWLLGSSTRFSVHLADAAVGKRLCSPQP